MSLALAGFPSISQAQTVSTAFETTDWVTAGGFSTFVEASSGTPNFQLTQGPSYGAGTPATGGLQAIMPTSITTTSRRSAAVRKEITSTASASAAVQTFETSILINPKELDDSNTNSRTGEVRLGFSSSATAPSTSTGNAHTYLEGNAIAVKLVAVHDNTTNNNRKLTLSLHNSSSSAFSGSSLTQNDATALFNNWLKLTLTVQRTSGNNYTASYRLDDLGTDGAGVPALVSALSTNSSPLQLSNTHLGGAASLYGAFTVSSQTSANVTPKATLLLDNYSYTTATAAPLAPVAQVATTLTTTNLTANWQANATGLGARNFVLELTKQSDNFSPDTFISPTGALAQSAGITLTPGTFSQIFTGLERGVAYVYRVRALNDHGASPDSNIITVSTSATNLPPTLDALAAPPSHFPGDTTARTVALSGIGNGGDLGQVISLTVNSSNPAVVPDPVIAYTSPAATGTLTYTPTGVTGTSTITVTVHDDDGGSLSRTFTVRVQQLPEVMAFDAASDLEEYATAQVNAATAFTAQGSGNPPSGGLQISKLLSANAAISNGWRTQSVSLSGKTYIYTSILINPREWNADNTFYTGLVLNTTGPGNAPLSSANGLFFHNSDYSTYRGISATFTYSSSSDRFRLQLRNKNSNSSSERMGSESDKSPVNATSKQNWLRLSLTLVATGAANTYSGSALLEDLGVDGTATPAVVCSVPATNLVNAAIAGSTQAYPAWSMSQADVNTGKTYLDSHQVVAISGPPEAPVALAPNGVITTTDLTARWQAPSSGPSPMLGYILEMIGPGGNFTSGPFIQANGSTAAAGISYTTPATLTQAFTNLARGTAYSYRVRGRNNSGEGANSNVIVTGTAPENIPPTLNQPAYQASLYPGDTTPVSVTLNGISHGGDAGQTIVITATSSNPSVVPDPVITYVSPAATGTLVYTPVGIEGAATITVSASDGEHQISRTFVVRVRQPVLTLGFEDALEFSSESAHESSSTGLTAAWSASAGTGTPSQGGVLINKTSTNAHSVFGYRRQPLNLVNKVHASTSILINPREWTGTSSSNGTLHAGFIMNSTGAATPPAGTALFTANNIYRGFGVRLNQNAGSANQFELQLFNKAAASSAANLGSLVAIPNASVLKSNWLRLSVEWMPSAIGGGNFHAIARLENMGPDGTSPPVLLANRQEGLTNVSMAAASAAYAAYNLALNSSNIGNTWLDDHFAQVNNNLPDAPVAGEASVITTSAFWANWSPPAANAYDSYVVEIVNGDDDFIPGNFANSEGEFVATAGLSVNDRYIHSLRLHNLEPDTSYRYRVKAINPLGGGTYSNIIEVTTLEEGGNLPPTLSEIPARGYQLAPGSGAYSVNFSGVSDGGEENQSLSVTAVSDNPGLIDHPVVTYSPNQATGSFQFIAGAAEGTANITVTVTDGPEEQVNRSVSRVYTIVLRNAPLVLGYDTAADLAAETTGWNNGSAGQVTSTWQENGGKGSPAGGGLKVTTTNSDRYSAVWRNQPYSLIGASAVSTSILINPREWGSGETNFAFGFTSLPPGSSVSEDFLSEKPEETVSFGISLGFRLKENKMEKLRMYNKRTASGEAGKLLDAPEFAVGTLRTRWLRLTLNLLPAGSSFTANYTLEDLGLSGTDTPALVYASANTTVANNTALFNAQQVYAACNVFYDKQAGTTYLDDHRVEVVYSLAPPVSQDASVIVANAFTAHWTPAANAFYTGYRLELSTLADNFAPNTLISATGATGQATGIDITGATARNQRITGLLPGTDYVYRVSGYNPNLVSEPSNHIQVITLPPGGNAQPLLGAITSAPVVVLRTTPYRVALTGISDGGEGNQILTVTAVSDNPAVIPHPVISYTSPAATGTLSYQAVGSGTANITVTVNDGGAATNVITRTFTVTVNPPPGEVLTFDGASDFNTGLLTDATNYTPAWNAAAGTGTPAGGGIRLTSSSASTKYFTAWKPQAFSIPGSTKLSTSVLVNMANINLTGELRLGFVTGGVLPGGTSGSTYLSSGTENAISVSLRSYNSSGARFQARLLNKPSASSASSVADVSLSRSGTINQWLRVTLELLPNGANTFLASYRIEGLGTSGTDEPTLIYAATPTTVTNAVLAAAHTVFGTYTFAASSSEAGVVYLDDYRVTVVDQPPPAPVALPSQFVTATSFQPCWMPTEDELFPSAYILEVSKTADAFAPGTLLDANGTGGKSTGIAIPSPSTLTLRIANLLPATSYSFRVVTVAPNGQNLSDYSNIVDTLTLDAGRNAAPTLNAIAAPLPLAPGYSKQPVPLGGITSGGETGQTLTVTAVSDNPAVAEISGISYTSPDATGTLLFKALSAGTATITVTVDDGQTTDHLVSRSFTVTVIPLRELLTFDTGDDYLAGTLNYSSGYASSWGAASGLGSPAGGGILLNSTTAASTKFTTVWKPQAFSVPESTQLSTSVTLNMAAINTVGELRLGFVTGGVVPGSPTTSSYLSSGSENALTVSLRSYDKSGNSRLEVRLLNKPSASGANATSEVTLNRANAVNQWIRVTLTLIPNGSNTFLASYRIEGLGTDGTGVPSLIYALNPVTTTNAALAAAPHAYGTYLFSAGSGEIGQVKLDNYEVVVNNNPPPAPVATESTLVTASGLQANWTPGIGILPPTGYVLELVRTGDAFEPGNFIGADGATGQAAGIPIAGVTVLRQRIQGLLPGESYQYQVRSTKGATISEPSNLIAVTTLGVGMNAPPTLNPIADPATVNVGAAQQTVNLSGISDGGEGIQVLTVTAVSSNPGIFPHPTVNYTSPAATGLLNYAPAPGATGSATITVTVDDGAATTHTITRSFTVTVGTPVVRIVAGALTTGSNAVGSVWKYLDNGTDQGTAWKEPAFNDTAWASGKAALGYGNTQATVVGYGLNPDAKYITTYFRHAFSIEDTSRILDVACRLRRDDGAIVYLNGTEIYRTNLPSGTVTYSTLASEASDDGGTFLSFTAPASLLVNGTNLIAVEVHQTSLSSSDLTMDLGMTTREVIPPVNVTALPATHVHAGGFTANWSLPANALVLGYVLEISKASDNFAPGTFVGSDGSVGNAAGIPIGSAAQLNEATYYLLPGTAYKYRVYSAGPRDAGITANEISVTTLPAGVNAPPTLDALADLTVVQNSGDTVVNLRGISDGGEGVQPLDVAAFSSDPTLIPSISVVYSSPAETGFLTFAPEEGLSGSAQITVLVNDGENSNNIVMRTFTVTVQPATPQIRIVPQPGTDALANGGTLAFGPGAPGVAMTRTIRIESVGNVSLTGLARTLSGNAGFTVSALSGTTLAAGTDTTLTVSFTPAGSGVVSGTLSIASNASGADPFVVNLTGSGYSALQTWRQQAFGTAENTGDAADHADPDFDGADNLMEFATGSKPLIPGSPAGYSTPVMTADHLTFTYPRSATALNDGISFIVEYNDGISGTWQSGGVIQTVTSQSGDIQTVQVEVPLDGKNRRFVRFRVAAP